MIDYISLDKIKYLCNLTSNTINSSVHFISYTDNENYSIFHKHSPSTSTINCKKLLLNFICKYSNLNLPILITTKYKFKFVMINLHTNYYLGSIFIGPFFDSSASYDYLGIRLPLSTELDINIEFIHENYNEIPIIDEKHLLNWTCLLFYSIYNSPIYEENILQVGNLHHDINFDAKNTYKDLLSKNRQNTTYHHSNFFIKSIYNDIKTGNIDKLLLDLDIELDGEIGIVAKGNELRNKKNLLISLITLCTQAAIDGGVATEIAFTLSDSFIQTLESINDISSLDNIHKKIVFVFAAKVKELSRVNYSKVTVSCINIINKYLYEDISLSHISKILNLSPQYISSLFKKDVGISLSEYILKTKIDEAKYLLIHTRRSILEVSTLLYFHDQSYFTKVFKKYTGVTPKKYSLGTFS